MTGLQEDVAAAHRVDAEHAQDIAQRVHKPQPPPEVPTEYVGLITRTIAFVMDAAVINIVAAIVAAATALIVSVFPVGHQVRTVIVAVGGVVYFAWLAGYFVTFWSTTGQTPGNRLMRIRVTKSDGASLKPRHALIRAVGLVLAALPLFAGFIPILLTERRRGLADWLADTVVVTSEPLPGLLQGFR